jgi:hypothetical protein
VTIEIQAPELEALIQDRMRSGAFESVEDVLLQALRSWPSRKEGSNSSAGGKSVITGAKLVSAMQTSPFKDLCLDVDSERSPVRNVAF